MNAYHLIRSFSPLSHSYLLREIDSSVLVAGEHETAWPFASSEVTALLSCYCLDLKNLARDVEEKRAVKISVHPVFLESQYLLKTNERIRYLKEMV